MFVILLFAVAFIKKMLMQCNYFYMEDDYKIKSIIRIWVSI